MPEQGHHSKVIILGVASQLLDGDYEGVLQQVIVDHAVGHGDVVIIATRGKQWISPVELNVSDCIGVIAENLKIISVYAVF